MSKNFNTSRTFLIEKRTRYSGLRSAATSTSDSIRFEQLEDYSITLNRYYSIPHNIFFNNYGADNVSLAHYRIFDRQRQRGIFQNIPRNLLGGQAGNWHAFSSISVSASLQSCRQCRHLICRPLPQVTLQLLQSIHLPHLRRGLLLVRYSPRANLEPLERI